MITTSEQNKALAAIQYSFAEQAGGTIRSRKISILQVNVGKLCNQACRHCHVDASPTRTEMLTESIAEKVLSALAQMPDCKTVDITGGAPEMNPVFRRLVSESKALGKHVIDRCNLTILEEDGFDWVAPFLAEHDVEVISSLPYFAASRTDAQRGKGVFDKSITALRKLNALGYGDRLPLNLVYNPSGLFLSAGQQSLEKEFKINLDKLDIRFNNLYCINNMPINRFLDSLIRNQKFEDYMEILVNAYNPSTLEGLMCRDQLSIGYDGRIYDCDFNQMLDLPAAVAHINDFDLKSLENREIVVGNHCYGCTAGAGSSCGGEIA